MCTVDPLPGGYQRAREPSLVCGYGSGTWSRRAGLQMTSRCGLRTRLTPHILKLRWGWRPSRAPLHDPGIETICKLLNTIGRLSKENRETCPPVQSRELHGVEMRECPVYSVLPSSTSGRCPGELPKPYSRSEPGKEGLAPPCVR